MITLPKRSVTRFFIPLIDVLILLFCIFLLMPFVSQPGLEEGMDSEALEPYTRQEHTDERLPENITDLQEQLRQARAEIERLKKIRGQLAESIAVQVLQIDPTNGQLFYHEGLDRHDIITQSDAQRLIDDHRRRAGAREPFFLIMYPRTLSGFPTQEQIDTYRRWFRDVPYGFDNPLASTA